MVFNRLLRQKNQRRHRHLGCSPWKDGLGLGLGLRPQRWPFHTAPILWMSASPRIFRLVAKLNPSTSAAKCRTCYYSYAALSEGGGSGGRCPAQPIPLLDGFVDVVIQAKFLAINPTHRRRIWLGLIARNLASMTTSTNPSSGDWLRSAPAPLPPSSLRAA